MNFANRRILRIRRKRGANHYRFCLCCVSYLFEFWRGIEGCGKIHASVEACDWRNCLLVGGGLI